MSIIAVSLTSLSSLSSSQSTLMGVPLKIGVSYRSGHAQVIPSGAVSSIVNWFGVFGARFL